MHPQPAQINYNMVKHLLCAQQMPCAFLIVGVHVELPCSTVGAYHQSNSHTAGNYNILSFFKLFKSVLIGMCTLLEVRGPLLASG